MFILTLFDTLFGCWHRHLSSPRSNARPGTATPKSLNNMHVTCLDCGRHFRYDWELMSITGPYQPDQHDLVSAQDSEESPLFI
jgi:hypothetical protein